jgi:hypothetical protein
MTNDQSTQRPSRRVTRTAQLENQDHVCARHAICFQCFRAGVERARARRHAWSQRQLPFEAAAPQLTPREIAHRQRMLAHLAQLKGA